MVVALVAFVGDRIEFGCLSVATTNKSVIESSGNLCWVITYSDTACWLTYHIT